MVIMCMGNSEAKRQNLENLKDVHKQMGWRLLMNEHVALEKNGDEIALLGIENWSAKARFSQVWQNGLSLSRVQKNILLKY